MSRCGRLFSLDCNSTGRTQAPYCHLGVFQSHLSSTAKQLITREGCLPARAALSALPGTTMVAPSQTPKLVLNCVPKSSEAWLLLQGLREERMPRETDITSALCLYLRSLHFRNSVYFMCTLSSGTSRSFIEYQLLGRILPVLAHLWNSGSPAPGLVGDVRKSWALLAA